MLWTLLNSGRHKSELFASKIFIEKVSAFRCEIRKECENYFFAKCPVRDLQHGINNAREYLWDQITAI